MKAIAAAIVFLWLLPASARPGQPTSPRPPCNGDPQPAYPELNTPAVVRIWNGDEVGSSWVPPACTGWTSPGFRILVALAARFRYRDGADGLMARFAAVSAWRSIRYWSVSDNGWRSLITDAAALSGPEVESRRSDFTVEEMKAGGDFFISQDDSRSAGAVVYRMQVLESRADRLVIRMENVSPVKAFLVTLFHVGDLQSIYFFDKSDADVWNYYSLAGTRESANPLARGHQDSYLNRASALYRHLTGLPADSPVQPAQ